MSNSFCRSCFPELLSFEKSLHAYILALNKLSGGSPIIFYLDGGICSENRETIITQKNTEIASLIKSARVFCQGEKTQFPVSVHFSDLYSFCVAGQHCYSKNYNFVEFHFFDICYFQNSQKRHNDRMFWRCKSLLEK